MHVSSCLRQAGSADAAAAVAAVLHEPSHPAASSLSGSVGENARVKKGAVPPEPETQHGRREAPKLERQAQAAVPSPYPITYEHVKRVSRIRTEPPLPSVQLRMQPSNNIAHRHPAVHNLHATRAFTLRSGCERQTSSLLCPVLPSPSVSLARCVCVSLGVQAHQPDRVAHSL